MVKWLTSDCTRLFFRPGSVSRFCSTTRRGSQWSSQRVTSWMRAGRKDKVIASLADGPHVLRPNTFNAYLAELEAFLVWAMETQGLGGPSELARAAARTALRRLFRSQRLNALPSQKKYVLSDDELARLLAIVDPRSADNPFNAQTRHRNYVIIRLLLETGLRRGELCKLRLEDLMLHGGSPYLKVVRRPDDPHDPRRHEPQVKTLNRSVPVSKPCALALTVYVQKHRGRARHPYVFTSTRGGRPIWTGAINEVLEQVVSAHPPFAGKLSPHGLRHYPEFRTIPSKLVVTAPSPWFAGASVASVCQSTRHSPRPG